MKYVTYYLGPVSKKRVSFLHSFETSGNQKQYSLNYMLHRFEYKINISFLCLLIHFKICF